MNDVTDTTYASHNPTDCRWCDHLNKEDVNGCWCPVCIEYEILDEGILDYLEQHVC